MPTYEYACRDCGQHLEVVQSFTEPPLRTCGACGGDLRKVFSAAGIIFKGSGYYVTDSRSARKDGDSSGSRKDGGKDGGKDGAKDGGTAAKSGEGASATADSGSGKNASTGSGAGEARSA